MNDVALASPESAWPVAARARLLEQRCLFAPAAIAYAAALARDTHLRRAALGLARCEVETRNWAAAAAALELAVEMDPADPVALYNLGSILATRLDRPRDALIRLQAANEHAPGDVDILVAIGVAAIKTGDRALATDSLVEACKLAPDDADVWYDLGVLHAADPLRRKDAVAAFRRALALGSPQEERLRGWIAELEAPVRP